MASHAPYRATILADDVAADTWYLVVDLSSTSYPHVDTNYIILKGLELQAEKASDGRYDIYLGVVLENDATNGTATWIWRWCLEADGNATDGTDRYVDEKDWTGFGLPPYDGLCLNIDNSIAANIVCSTATGDLTALQNDAGNFIDAVGNTDANVAAGDLVMYIDERSGSGTISVNLSVIYDTK